MPNAEKSAVKSLFKTLIFLIISTHITYAEEGFIRLKQPKIQSSNSGTFTVPNERNPERALKVYKQAPKGVYVSVGTERGFIGAANSPRVTHLLLLDVDNEVVRYNQVNTILLKISKNREDYLRLRLATETSDWMTSAKEAKLSVEEIQKLEDSHLIFKQEVASKGFKALQNPDLNSREFSGVNYMQDDVLFNKIQKMAKDGRISSGIANISDANQMEQIFMQLSAKNLQVSIFDVSNAWWKKYSNWKKFAPVLENILEHGESNSLLLATSYTEISRHYHAYKDGIETPWSYRALSFGNIKKNMDSSGEKALEYLTSSFGFFGGQKVKIDSESNSNRCLMKILKILN